MPGEDTPRERPRPWLLAALGVAIVALIVYWMWPSAGTAIAPSNQAGGARGRQAAGRGSSPPLDVRLDALNQPPPEPNEAERNPFRFQPKAPPPPPPEAFKPPTGRGPVQPLPPPAQMGPPPIPLKYFGYFEDRLGKIAGLSDSRGVYKGREGAIIEGRYRIVKIGVESIVMEYTDGTGRQTIPLRGQ
jgi:hypothetical protein